jgi:aspartate-semialdehyde dehydrogenase
VSDGVRVALVGATGVVGQEILKLLVQRKFKLKDLVCLADPSEEGTKIKFGEETLTVRGAREDSFTGIDIAFFAVGTEVSNYFAPLAVKKNCLVIDNSYAFRLKEDVPLVIPEINPQDINWHKGIIANPNCSTIIMAVAINPIHQAARLKRVVVSTYQAVSGAGKAGVDELEQSIHAYVNGTEANPAVFQYPIAFNLIPHIDIFMEENYTREEMKLVYETQKIMHAPDLRIAATAVRVPVYRSHSESITVETEKELTVDEVKSILSRAPGVVVQDNPQEKIYPMPLYTANTDEVYVGRIRKDISCKNGFMLWAVGDQIRKGAATNAVQIAELVVQRNLY